MFSRIFGAVVLAMALLLGACGGSSDPSPAPAADLDASAAISEADAVASAQAALAERGLSYEGLVVKPSSIFGEWQVSFEPASGESLKGGYLVVLNADDGEFVDLVVYR